ncbi:MAG: hypothetical protein ACF8LK_09650, partial [Phycisphaerales bacterium JB041]
DARAHEPGGPPVTLKQSVILLAFTAAVSMLMVAAAAARSSAAAAAASSAEATLQAVRSRAQRVLELRSRVQTVALGAQPQADAFHRVSETLSACGLTSTRIESVTPSGDRTLPGDDASAARRVQTLRVAMSPVLLDELGSFLDRWRREHGLWTVTGIDLTPISNRAAPQGAFRATLTAAAVYVDTGAGDRPAQMEQRP